MHWVLEDIVGGGEGKDDDVYGVGVEVCGRVVMECLSLAVHSTDGELAVETCGAKPFM